MLKEPTLERLQALRLLAMAAAWDEQQRHPDIQAMTFDERFALLVEAEWVARETKRVARALKEAKLRLSQACIEGVECGSRRELDKAVVRQLATCRWIEEHHSVLISGATGTGKMKWTPSFGPKWRRAKVWSALCGSESVVRCSLPSRGMTAQPAIIGVASQLAMRMRTTLG
jgi:hypothetical protein